jgi:hypothetical protein
MDSKKSRLVVAKAIISTLLAVLLLVAAWTWAERSLARPDFMTGYTLLAVTLGMMLLSMRKRLMVLPLGSMAVWQKTHQYLGLFAIASYLLHAGIVIHGGVEWILAFLFWAISLSGLLGWYINHSTPKKLRAAGPGVLREDMNTLRQEIAHRAYGLALTAAGRNESASLSEHYLHHLRSFFQNRRSLAYCLVPSGRMKRHLLHELDQIVRYLGPEGQASYATMAQLVRQKDDLDFQWALQNRLRGWVIAHISLIWSFYLVVAIHVYTVHRFHGN